MITVNGRKLTLSEIEAVARRREPVSLDPSARGAIEKSARFKEELIEMGVPVYGVTTGVGDSVHVQIAHDRAALLQRNLMHKLGCGTGPYLPEEYARAVMLLRANTLARGQSAVRPVIVETILACLNAGIASCIPEEGSVGASGDLVPLSYVAATICGERNAWHDGKPRPANELLAAAGIRPVELLAKEGLAIWNGTAFMAGIAALVTLDAQRLSLLADIATAMTTEVLTASSGPFHAFLHEGTKPHPGQCRSAANIRHLLEGSELSQAYQKIVGGLGQLSGGMRKLPTKIQSKYSVRCAPHFIGVLNDTIDWCERWLDVEMNSANDNPLFDADEGEVHSGGNFAGGHVAFLADSLKTAVASVADLLDRQFELIVDEKFSEGLPSNLSPELPPDHPEAGTHHGFKGVQLAVSSLTAEALGRCLPMTIFSRSTEAHNQDKVSMGATAARGARDVVVLAEKVAAFHLLALCQAADFRDARKLGRTRAVYERIRRESEKVTGDRELAGDLERLLSCIRSGELTRLAFAASK